MAGRQAWRWDMYIDGHVCEHSHYSSRDAAPAGPRPGRRRAHSPERERQGTVHLVSMSSLGVAREQLAAMLGAFRAQGSWPCPL